MKKLLITLTFFILPITSYADGTGLPDKISDYSNDGQEIYRSLCASCHMQDGEGAEGAGFYPSLVNNEKLESPVYIEDVILYGVHAMPAIGGLLNDEQIANVINYVRSHFDNHYRDKVSAKDISQLRAPNFQYDTVDEG